jgi:DNA transposition AAA+ family ATPase
MTEAAFVETSVSRDIFRTINLARDLHKCAAIVGPPGGGKSRTLRVCQETERSVYLMTVTAVTGNALRDLFRELADIMSFYVSGSIADMQRQMFRYDLSGQVLIIDEAQNLKLQAFRELLHLHDFAGLVIVFCGNNEVIKRVSTDKGAFAQISRRVPIRTEVNGILDEDADNLARAFGVEGADAFGLIRTIGARFHVDGVVTVLEIARRVAGTGAIRAAHVRTACEALPHYRSAITRALA